MGYVVHDLTQDTTDDEEEDKTLISTSGGIDDEDANDAVAAVVPDGVGGGSSCNFADTRDAIFGHRRKSNSAFSQTLYLLQKNKIHFCVV